MSRLALTEPEEIELHGLELLKRLTPQAAERLRVLKDKRVHQEAAAAARKRVPEKEYRQLRKEHRKKKAAIAPVDHAERAQRKFLWFRTDLHALGICLLLDIHGADPIESDQPGLRERLTQAMERKKSLDEEDLGMARFPDLEAIRQTDHILTWEQRWTAIRRLCNKNPAAGRMAAELEMIDQRIRDEAKSEWVTQWLWRERASRLQHIERLGHAAEYLLETRETGMLAAFYAANLPGVELEWMPRLVWQFHSDPRYDQVAYNFLFLQDAQRMHEYCRSPAGQAIDLRAREMAGKPCDHASIIDVILCSSLPGNQKKRDALYKALLAIPAAELKTDDAALKRVPVKAVNDWSSWLCNWDELPLWKVRYDTYIERSKGKSGDLIYWRGKLQYDFRAFALDVHRHAHYIFVDWVLHKEHYEL